MSETGTIVLHLDNQRLLFPAKPHPDVPTRRMLERIMDKFLNDPVYIALCKRAHWHFFTIGRQLNVQTAWSFHVLTKYVNAIVESIAFHRNRHQLARDSAHRLSDIVKLGFHTCNQ